MRGKPKVLRNEEQKREHNGRPPAVLLADDPSISFDDWAYMRLSCISTPVQQVENYNRFHDSKGTSSPYNR